MRLAFVPVDDIGSTPGFVFPNIASGHSIVEHNALAF